MDSIIFDLDGTLWDSTDPILNVWNNVLKTKKEIKKLLTVEDLQGCMGLQMKEIGQKLFPYLEEGARGKILDECCLVETEYLCEHGGTLYENLEETLKVLSQKYKLFIVSNCQIGYIESFYHFHQLEHYFLDFENPGRTGLSKGENIKLIMERNNLKNPVYVGDTEGDMKAAQFAGIPFVYASYGFGKVSHFDYSIKKIEELVELF
ncbi:HAD family hydrolase [Bacillus sp. CGMCC 1.16607]|uniref:HAD family hydrolase n=1 Tax=Bacillus sp. CGMCC 1.16607 TaxID=3351842 RepID=UPI00363105BF